MKDYIFISYARTDQKRIQPIIRILKEQGWSVWWDHEIPPGKIFDEVIEKAIDGAKCVIVIWSKRSILSKWVRTEANEGEKRGILIPILIDNVQIPLAFRLIETANLIDWDGITKNSELNILLSSIAILIGHPKKETNSLVQKDYNQNILKLLTEQKNNEKSEHISINNKKSTTQKKETNSQTKKINYNLQTKINKNFEKAKSEKIGKKLSKKNYTRLAAIFFTIGFIIAGLIPLVCTSYTSYKGTLTVITKPENATIKIIDSNNQDIDYTPGMKIMYGSYQLSVSADLYLKVTKLINIFANKPTKELIILKCKNPIYPKQVDPKCGVKKYNKGMGIVCGVEKYKAKNSSACLPKLFKLKRSKECGPEKYNFCKTFHCGTRIKHKIGSLKPDIETKFCEHETCGVRLWKECRHPNFGVELYEVCRDPSHGVESYKSCEHNTFGVAEYNECRHPDFGVERCGS